MSAPRLDEAFAALDLAPLRDAALSTLAALGVTHGDLRVEQIRSRDLTLRDAAVENTASGQVLGVAVRVVHDGSYGFAAGVDLTPDGVRELARTAVELARVSRPLTRRAVQWAPEATHTGTWLSPYRVDPFEVPEADAVAVLADYSRRLLAAPGIRHVDTSAQAVKECKYYADTAGTETTQQRVRVQAALTAVAPLPDGGVETLRTLAAPVGRGWEWLTDGPAGGCHDWAAELAELPEQLAEKCAAPGVEPGRYDLVIDPTNLFLTIHESIGHATELDRALGYEANYAGTSFATLDQLNRLRYGSPLMHVTGDRTAEHGLATIGWDDEGVAAQSFDLIRDGVLVGYQLDRRMAAEQGFGRSNGCAFADSPAHVPVQRMANVSLAAAPGGPSTEELISGVTDGIYIVGDRSWSIDMQRYNFQFTGQRFYRISGGRIAGMLRDVAYQATTTDFWNAMVGVGGPSTYVLGGAFNCGKAQPGQVAAVSHGCPSALFSGIRVLNTSRESA